MGRAIEPSAASASAGSGCSTRVTPAAAQAARFAARLPAVQPSLASTISSAARRRRPHRRDALGIAGAAELDLEELASGRGLRRRRHHLRRAERDRVGGGQRLRGGEPGELMRGLSGALGLEIPERAVERIARRAGRHGLLQRHAVEAERQLVADRAERRHHARDGLAIARIGHAFAAAPVAAVVQLDDDHLGLGLGAAADREGAGDRPAFGAHGQRQGQGRQ